MNTKTTIKVSSVILTLSLLAQTSHALLLSAAFTEGRMAKATSAEKARVVGKIGGVSLAVPLLLGLTHANILGAVIMFLDDSSLSGKSIDSMASVFSQHGASAEAAQNTAIMLSNSAKSSAVSQDGSQAIITVEDLQKAAGDFYGTQGFEKALVEIGAVQVQTGEASEK